MKASMRAVKQSGITKTLQDGPRLLLVTKRKSLGKNWSTVKISLP